MANTGLGHDDQGHVDDRRVAGWVMLGAAVGMAVATLWPRYSIDPEIIKAFLLAGVALMGVTVAEKFGRDR